MALDQIEKLRKIARTEFDPVLFRIDEMLDARGRCDFFRMMSILSPSTSLHMVGDRSLCRAFGKAEGRDASLNFLESMASEYAWKEWSVDDIIGIDNVYAVQRSTICHRFEGGSKLRLRSCTLFKFSEGLISSVVDYSDTHTMIELMSGAGNK